jgi:hypothetical protein
MDAKSMASRKINVSGKPEVSKLRLTQKEQVGSRTMHATSHVIPSGRPSNRAIAAEVKRKRDTIPARPCPNFLLIPAIDYSLVS